MVMTQEVESLNTIDCIRRKLEERMLELGKVYYDEATKYLITSELVAKTNNEIRLVNDITYLLTKVSLLERMYAEEVKILEDRLNDKSMQTTIEESLGMDEERLLDGGT